MKAVEMTPNEMIKDLNLKNALIDYHYDVNEEFQNVDDIEDSENIIDYIQSMIDEAYGEENENYVIAVMLYSMIKDDVIEEIMIRDEDAKDYEEAKKERF